MLPFFFGKTTDIKLLVDSNFRKSISHLLNLSESQPPFLCFACLKLVVDLPCSEYVQRRKRSAVAATSVQFGVLGGRRDEKAKIICKNNICELKRL